MAAFHGGSAVDTQSSPPSTPRIVWTQHQVRGACRAHMKAVGRREEGARPIRVMIISISSINYVIITNNPMWITSSHRVRLRQVIPFRRQRPIHSLKHIVVSCIRRRLRPCLRSHLRRRDLSPIRFHMIFGRVGYSEGRGAQGKW